MEMRATISFEEFKETLMQEVRKSEERRIEKNDLEKHTIVYKDFKQFDDFFAGKVIVCRYELGKDEREATVYKASYLGNRYTSDFMGLDAEMLKSLASLVSKKQK
jgi:hypothetical protein